MVLSGGVSKLTMNTILYESWLLNFEGYNRVKDDSKGNIQGEKIKNRSHPTYVSIEV